MNVARVLYPVQTLGPGNRVGIWLCGCHRRCKGCSNPELWEEKPEYVISAEELGSAIETILKDRQIDGFTISGGEPMNQAAELSSLLDLLEKISNDILIYTGYTIEELLSSKSGHQIDCVKKAGVIIDGMYIEEKNTGQIMVGSSNQRIVIIKKELDEKYRNYLRKQELEIQNFTGADDVYSIGIHRTGFPEEMIERLKQKRSEDHESVYPEMA